MEQWEFLIQKAGDRDWLPLPSPESEILEGRYRLMAHLAHANCPVEVRIRHLDIQAMPPRRKLLRRRDRTNADGLVALLPFTMLQAGVWSIQCAVKSGAGEIRVHSLQIQVLEQVADGDVEFDIIPDVVQSEPAIQAEEQPAAVANPFEQAATHLEALEAVDLDAVDLEAIDPESLDEINRLFQTAEELAEHIIASMAKKFDELAAVLDEAAVVESEVPPAGSQWLTAAAAPGLPDADAGELFDEPLDEASGESPAERPAEHSGEAPGEPSARPPAKPANELPAASPKEQVAARATPSANIPAPPVESASIIGTIHISVEQDTYVLHRDRPFTVTGQLEAIAPAQPPHPLDARLRLSLADPQTGRRLMLQDQLMRITTLPHFFACAIAQPTLPKTHLLLGQLILTDSQATDADSESIWASQSFVVTTDLNDLLDTVTQAAPQDRLQPPPEFAPLPEKATPSARVTAPNLRQSPAPQSTFRPAGNDPLPPRLTPSGSPSPRTTIELPSFVKGSATASSGVAIALAHAVRSAQSSTTAPETSPATADGTPDASDRQPLPDADAPALTGSETPRPPQPISALESPAGGATTGEAVLPTPPADAPLPQAVPDPVEPTNLPPPEAEPTNGIPTQEIVVDDSGEESDRQRPEPPAASPQPSHLPGLTLPEDVPIPTPDVILPPGELVAGEAVPVAVLLPVRQARIYVKLWIYDRQTRSMTAPPRWLTDLSPDGQGYLKTTVQLTVPQGCLEIVVEAIAVEALTQRESRKVSLARPVAPANLPPLLGDDPGII